MTMGYTMQNPFEPMMAEVTSDHSPIDGSTAGSTCDYNDKPSYSYKLRPDCNIAEMIFSSADGTANKTVSGYLLAYGAGQSPAVRIADISFTLGTARIGDSTTSLWYDTAAIKTDYHLTTVAEKDTAGNRIVKLAVDTLGYAEFLWQFADLTVGQSIRPHIRTF